MRTLIIITLAAWALFLPSLCVAGFFDHVCAECADSCEHERACMDDPCAKIVVRAEASFDGSLIGPPAVLPQSLAIHAPWPPAVEPVALQPSDPPSVLCLPVLESDIPLLN